MLASLQQSVPEQWRGAIQFLASGFTWILDWQALVLGFSTSGSSAGEITLKGVLLLPPIALLVAAMWCTMASLYTLPSDPGGGFLTAVLVVVGRRTDDLVLLGRDCAVRGRPGGVDLGPPGLPARCSCGSSSSFSPRPFALLDWATRQYFQPGVPWIAFVFILVWSALEATIFTFTLRPTVTEVLADLTGSELSGIAVSLILWPFLLSSFPGASPRSRRWSTRFARARRPKSWRWRWSRRS
jgi:hypothetical protein